MWTSSNTTLHHTHQHDALFNRDGDQANLATDRSPVEEGTPEEPSDSRVRPDVSFSDALQIAAEGN